MRKKNAGNIISKAMVITLAFIMLCSTMMAGIGGLQQVYAKAIGEKNEDQLTATQNVIGGIAPDDYEKLLTGADATSVFRGGNSRSKWINQSGWYNGFSLDEDPNDFGKPLPYGNTYVDTSKLIWDDPEGFIIDIQDDRFKWVSPTPLTDNAGHTSISDPMGNGLYNASLSNNVVNISPVGEGIYYVGELHSYLPKTTDPAQNIDTEKQDPNGSNMIGPNMIEPQGGAPYLYRITYLNAVTLPDGTRGNLQLTMEGMQIESSFTTNAANPYVTKNGVSYDKAIIQVQGTNSLSMATNLADANKDWLNPYEFVAITADEAAQIRTDVNENLPEGQKLGVNFNNEKTTRHAVGGLLDLGITVTDQTGQKVTGTISYAAHDLDLTSAEGIWGRPITRNGNGTYDTKFGEGMRILSGSLSYALTPEYKHEYNRDPANQPTEQQYGWVEKGPSESAKESPLAVTRDRTIEGVGTGPADGVRFSSSGITNLRDKNGTFQNAIFNASTIRTPQYHQASSGALKYKTLNDEQFGGYDPSNPTQGINNRDNAKKLIYGMMKRDGFTGAPATWEDLTMTQTYQYLEDASWKTDRNDDNDLSFDTGFAVLLDAAGSKLQWSASRISGGGISTTLFDSSMYTFVQTTHGTGGGIYLEVYDIRNNAKPVRDEGTTTMGRGVNPTVTAVPEDGHRVKSITVGNMDLSDSTEYTIVYDDSGKATGINDGTTTHNLSGGKVTIGGTDFEVNSDGTIDVTLNDIQDPRHVHVDFTADYYFYKVWKSDKTPTLLKLTATPFAFVFKSVDIEGTKYDIEKTGSGYTFTGGEKTYTLKNNSFTVGEGADAVTYFLEGNSLVTYKYEDGNRVKNKEYHIHLEYEQKGDPMSFIVREADADDATETNVQAGTEDGNTVWKIRYPADGYETKSGDIWDELSIESDPGTHDHTHVERIYWFVTEDYAPGWSLVEYNNSTAEAPGKIDAAKGRKEIYAEGDSGKLSSWASASTKDYEDAETEIESAADNDHAYMSVFSNHDKAITKHNSWGGKIVNEVLPPVGTPKQTWGEKGAPQSTSGKDMFTVKTETAAEGTPNVIEEVKLIDPKTGQAVDEVTVPEGKYTVSNDGTITFTPNDPNYVGDPTPVGVRGTDSNGLSADTTYTPHICDTETTVKRTIVYEYNDGTPVTDSSGQPLTVVQEVTFKGVLNPETGEVTYPGNPTETFDEVQSDSIDGYTVDRDKVDEVTVRPHDKDLFEKVIYSPNGVKAAADTTWGLPGSPQKGTPTFEMETETYTDGTPNELTVKLINPKTGEETDSKTVDAVDSDGNKVGTYTLNDDGTVTFTPNEGYVGNPRPLELTGTDRFGTKARTTYTPHIVDPIEEDTASRTIYYTYLTEDGKEAADSITQTVKMTKHAKKVDSKTGEVLEWADWDPAEFPAVPNPKGVDEKTWTANTSAKAQKVTTPGKKDDVHIIYTKEPYTVKYLDGNHGKSDRKGNQSGEDYGNDVKGGNGVTPAKGWHFTGKYTYVIKDKNGKVIGQGETDDPTSIEITGNIEFTPVYEPNRYTIKYDANGGKGSMDDQHFTGADDSARSKKNEFTRKGYEFAGFKAKLPDGSYLKDENGNDIIFMDENDFLEYLLEYGDGAEITLEAQWVKSEYAEPGSSGGVATGDGTDTALWIALMAAAAASALVMMKRRRSKS